MAQLTLPSPILPDKLKIAKVIPIFKKDDSSLFKNYRPISLLPTFSKVLEKTIYSQLYAYLTIINFILKINMALYKTTRLNVQHMN